MRIDKAEHSDPGSAQVTNSEHIKSNAVLTERNIQAVLDICGGLERRCGLQHIVFIFSDVKDERAEVIFLQLH